MDITSSSFGAVSSPYYAGTVQPRQATFTPSYATVPDTFQKQNQDDQQQQQNQELVDVPGMEHHLIHQLHHI